MPLPERPSRDPAPRRLLAMSAFTLLYFLAARAGMSVVTVPTAASPSWPASGVAIAAVILLGNRAWPAVLIGALLAHSKPGASWPAVGAIALGSTLAALFGAYCYRRLSSRTELFEHHAETAGTVIAAPLAALVSAAIGPAALLLSGVFGRADFISVFKTWWIGDSVGPLTYLPLLLCLGRRKCDTFPNARKILEFLLLLAGCSWIYLMILGGVWGSNFLFLLFPTLLLAALRLGKSGVLFFTLTASVIGAWKTVHGTGLFHAGTTNENLIYLQVFMGAFAVTGLMLSDFAEVRRSVRLFIPIAVLLSSWTLCGVIYAVIHNSHREAEFVLFSELVRDTQNELISRMANYEDALQAAVELKTLAPAFVDNEWQVYADSLNLKKRFPGLRGVGVARPFAFQGTGQVLKLQLPWNRRSIRCRSLPGRDTSRQKESFIVTRIAWAPEVAGRADLIGLDLATERARREAAERSRDTGRPVLSERILLAHEPHNRPGFLLFAPFYAPTPTPLKTVEQRRKAHQGWIFAPLVAQDFFANSLEFPTQQMKLAVYSDDSMSPASLIYDSHPGTDGRRVLVTHAEFAQRELTLEWRKFQGLPSTHDMTFAWAGAFCGLFSIFLTALIVNLKALNARANAMVQTRSAELHEQQALLVSASKFSSLGEMAGGIAHGINNPLMIISGRSQQLSRLAESETLDREQIRSTAAKIQQTTERISKIVRGLRAFARNADQDPFNISPLSSILETTLEMCKERFKNNGIELRVTPVPDVNILCRETQIAQVLLNLLNNAFDAVKPLSTKWVEIAVFARSEQIEISVTDSGPGIPQEILDKIMKPFFTTKGLGNGTGLGLVISRRIIEQHEGELRYDASSPNTRFVIKLPATR